MQITSSSDHVKGEMEDSIETLSSLRKSFAIIVQRLQLATIMLRRVRGSGNYVTG
jgi:hypothetical protein